MNILAPSILSADFARLGEQVKKVEKAGAQYLHFDVMDGHFVPNISFGIPVLECVRNITDLTLDVHLMVEEPEKFIDSFAEAGADIINFHFEAVADPFVLIKKIKNLSKRVAITVKPETDISCIFKYADMLDMVLIMSVEPGFGGQELIAESLNKARKLRDYINENNITLDIEMDGGIYLGNISKVIESGVNVVVSGSAVFGSEDIERKTKEFMGLMK